MQASTVLPQPCTWLASHTFHHQRTKNGRNCQSKYLCFVFGCSCFDMLSVVALVTHIMLMIRFHCI